MKTFVLRSLGETEDKFIDPSITETFSLYTSSDHVWTYFKPFSKNTLQISHQSSRSRNLTRSAQFQSRKTELTI